MGSIVSFDGFVSLNVLCRWYDEVNIVYGPVGHTHTGVDAEHRKHNRVIVFASCIVYFAISVSRA